MYNNNFKIKYFHAREDMNLNEFADFGSKKYIWYIKPIDDSKKLNAEYAFKIYAVDWPVLQNLYMNANMFNLPRTNRNIGGRRNTVHFLFFLTRFHFLTAKTVLISFDNLILSIRSRSPAQWLHLSRANQTTLERQFVSAPGHSYYNCNTTKTSVALPIRA